MHVYEANSIDSSSLANQLVADYSRNGIHLSNELQQEYSE